ncbi:MAG: cation:proton antiporter, partial [Bacteroidota bacterium]
VPLSVMSSAIIIPSVHHFSDHFKKEFLIYESAFSDILGIIAFYALLDIGGGETSGMSDVALSISGNLGLTIILSIIISYVLIVIFQFVKGEVKLFMLIAVLLVLYAGGKLLHLSSLVTILIFGLMLNNKDLFFRGGLTYLIKDKEYDDILKNFRVVTLETAFVIRTFFFVAFGMSIILGQLFHWSVPVITVIALIAIYGTRFLGLKALFPKKSIEPEIFIAPRGLITVLLFYKIPAQHASDAFQPGILLLTILITGLVLTYGLIRYAKRNPQTHGHGEESTPQAQMETQNNH